MGKLADFDEALDTVGGGGWYQWAICLLASSIVIHTGINVTLTIYLDYVPDKIRCYVPEFDGNDIDTFDKPCLNDTIPCEKRGNVITYSQCQYYKRNYSSSCIPPSNYSSVANCDEWVYDRNIMSETTVTEWNLVCQNDPWRVVGQSTYMIGVMFGSFAFGTISDLYGRKTGYIAATLQMLVFSVATSFAPNLPLYLLGRFLIGMGGIGCFLVSFVLCVELIHSRHRVAMGTLIECVYTACYPAVAGLAYSFRNWHRLHLWAALTALPWLAVAAIIPESPRWLLSTGRYAEADQYLRRVARANGLTPGDAPLIGVGGTDAAASGSSQTLSENEITRSVSLADVFRSRELRKRCLIITSSWFVNAVVYFGVSLNASSLNGDIFVNVILLGVVEFLGYAVCVFVIDRFGRRWPLCLAEVLAGVFCLASALAESAPSWVPLALALVGKFCISASFCIVYIYTGELFPTVTRNSAIGFANLLSRIGAIGAPFVLLLDDYVPSFPSVSFVIFGVVAITVGLQVLFLPETLNTMMPDTIDQAENLSQSCSVPADTSETCPLISEEN